MSSRSRRNIARVNYRRLNVGDDHDESEDEPTAEIEEDIEEEVEGSASETEDVVEEGSESEESEESEEEMVQLPLQRNVTPSTAGSSNQSQRIARSHTFKGTDGTIWNDQVPASTRPRVHNILQNVQVGPANGALAPDLSMKQTFELLITDTMITDIVKWTNEFSFHSIQKENDRNGTNKVWLPTTNNEIKALLGLLLLGGIQRSCRQSIKEMWSKNLAIRRHAFPAAMSCKRFENLMNMLRFDDTVLRHTNQERNRAAQRNNLPIPHEISKEEPIRELYDQFSNNLRTLYTPAEYITVDEMLVKFRGKAPFRVYMKSKPGKYGLKIWAAVDNASGYVLNIQIYTGKLNDQRETEQGKRVVRDLVEPFLDNGRGITADNFFSSKSLCEELLQRRTTYVGTIRKNRRELPKDVLQIRGKPKFDSQFLFTGDITLVRYITNSKKPVCLVSTQHHGADIDETREDKKPLIILHYNETKGGVDTADMMIASYSCQRPTKRWPLKIFLSLVDIAALNAYKLYVANNLNWQPNNRSRRHNFIRELAFQLLIPHMQERSLIPQLNKNIRISMESFVQYGLQLTANVVPVPQPIVQRAVGGAEGGSRGIDRCGKCTGPKRSRKNTRQVCSLCGIPVCKDHSQKIISVRCTDCAVVQDAPGVPEVAAYEEIAEENEEMAE